MPSFKGQAEYSVDSKGRMAIPARMRSAMNPEAKGAFTITRGLEQCIFLYPLDRWEEIEQEMYERNMYDRNTRVFIRNLTRWAEDVELDSQGRIRIPERLMQFAEISDQATVIGALDRIEIWAPDVFENYLNAQDDDYETLAESVMGL